MPVIRIKVVKVMRSKRRDKSRPRRQPFMHSKLQMVRFELMVLVRRNLSEKGVGKGNTGNEVFGRRRGKERAAKDPLFPSNRSHANTHGTGIAAREKS